MISTNNYSKHERNQIKLIGVGNQTKINQQIAYKRSYLNLCQFL